jgi:hypothetical protein
MVVVTAVNGLGDERVLRSRNLRVIVRVLQRFPTPPLISPLLGCGCRLLFGLDLDAIDSLWSQARSLVKLAQPGRDA